jgi:hypothetical protein
MIMPFMPGGREMQRWKDFERASKGPETYRPSSTERLAIRMFVLGRS